MSSSGYFILWSTKISFDSCESLYLYYKPMIKPMEIAFDDIKHIIIDVLLVECHLCYFIFGSVNVTNTDFRIWCARKNNFVAANIAAIILPRSVCSDPQIKRFGWLVVFNVPSTARSFRDGTPIYCPLRRTWSSINTPFRSGIKPRAVAWQSITLPLRYASSTQIKRSVEQWF